MRIYHILILLMLIPLVYAKEYHMTLLAVTEHTGEPEGSIADLYLEIAPGSGRIFIDTFPLTRIDTQISTRFAKSIACNHAGIDCSDKDFFYTIRSNSVIIGGPSAGGALSVLTIAALENLDVDENIAISGTINSGGLIGPVGTLDKKIEAGARANLTMILIPKGEKFLKKDNETTIDLIDFGKNIGVQVREVATIDEALLEITGWVVAKDYGDIEVESRYTSVMESISLQLCNRTMELLSRIKKDNSTLYMQAVNLSVKSQKALLDKHFYSGASFCFGANIKLSNKILEDADNEDLRLLLNKEQKKLIEFNKKIEAYDLKTINDLQAYEIVKERLLDAEDYFKKAVDAIRKNQSIDARYSLAYGIERYNSAVSWSSFFGNEGTNLDIEPDMIKSSCIEKLSEAEERYQYVQLYMPLKLEETRKHIDRAYEDLKNEDYTLCLFKASKAKAEANVVLSAIGVLDEKLSGYLSTKLELVEQVIARQQAHGNFPILGYSYYEYAKSLEHSDVYSALIYTEYALELSNIDIYFAKKSKKRMILIDTRLVLAFALGALLGGLLAFQLRPKGLHIRMKRKTLANTRTMPRCLRGKKR